MPYINHLSYFITAQIRNGYALISTQKTPPVCLPGGGLGLKVCVSFRLLQCVNKFIYCLTDDA